MINPVTNTQGVSPINTKYAEHVVTRKLNMITLMNHPIYMIRSIYPV